MMWEGIHICDKHLQELGPSWSKVKYNHQPQERLKNVNNQAVCGYDKKRVIQVMANGQIRGFPVTSEEAKANLREHNFLLHIGVCEFGFPSFSSEVYLSQTFARIITNISAA